MASFFDIQIASLTLKNVAVLLLFVAVGYVMRHWHKLPDNAAGMVSVLATFVFLPAYNISNLSTAFTREMLRENLILLGVSCFWCAVVLVVGRVLGKLLGRDDFDRKSLYYMLAFTNNGFFGYPVIEGVFGTETLARFLIFSIPIGFIGNFYGYGLFSGKRNFNVKNALFSIVNVSSLIGCVLGLLGVSLPGFLESALTTAGSCMSPAAMILTGLVLGGFSLKDLLCHLRPYFISSLRLIVIPLVLIPLFYLVGLRGENFFFCAVISCLPMGLNSVVYPEACGFDASQNAKAACISFLMSLFTLPVMFSAVMGMLAL